MDSALLLGEYIHIWYHFKAYDLPNQIINMFSLESVYMSQYFGDSGHSGNRSICKTLIMLSYNP